MNTGILAFLIISIYNFLWFLNHKDTYIEALLFKNKENKKLTEIIYVFNVAGLIFLILGIIQ
jgi:ABC-type transport system involved in cytochrome c biogenesis permease subunit